MDSKCIFEKIDIFIIFQCGRAPGTRPEALGTPGIDSTSIKKNCFFRCFTFFLNFHKYFAYKRTLDGLKSRFDPLEL